jgi:predicted nucleotidyltransferase
MKLLACTLSSDHEKIYLNLEWQGPFRNIQSLSISGLTQLFWYATCNSEDATLSLNMLRYFLYLQVDTVWSENKVLPGKIEPNGNLTASIQFLRANSLELPFELPLSETAAENASNFVVRQYYPRHIEVSEKLEVKLREELERRQQYVAQGLLKSELTDQFDSRTSMALTPLAFEPRDRFPFLSNLSISVGGGRGFGKGIVNFEDDALSTVFAVLFNVFALDDWECVEDVGSIVAIDAVNMEKGGIEFRPDQALIQIDLDPRTIGRMHVPALGIIGDARDGLAGILAAMAPGAPVAEWDWAALRQARDARSPRYTSTVDHLLRALREALPADGIVVGDQTGLNYWMEWHLPILAPRTFLYPIGSATLGYGVPAAIGAKIAHPDRAVVAVVGDGGLLFTAAELATAAKYRLAIVYVVMNDQDYGAIRYLQAQLYGRTGEHALVGPDILALAREVAGIVRRATRSPGYRVFLFGSHVSGEAGPRSDIDIGIEGPAPLDADVMQAIREACERLPTLCTIDLVDFASVRPEFRRGASVWPVAPDPG